MYKRAFLFLLLTLIWTIFPAAAQDRSAADYVPADFAGFVRLRLDNPAQTLQALNITAFTAAQLQPNRLQLPNAALSYDNFITLTTLFDVETAAFGETILPWLDGEMVIAYRDFDDQLQTPPEDILLIMLTDDVLESASRLSSIIQAQDLPEKETYLGITIYQGDKSAIALTAPAVFAGPVELVRAALDVQAGVTPPITTNPIYQTLYAHSDQEAPIFAYVDAEHVLPAVSGLMAGAENTQTLLTAFGGALTELRGSGNFESLLFNGGFDGAAGTLSVEVGDEYITTRGKALFHTLTPFPAVVTSENQPDLMTFIPRNAMLAGSGGDARGMIYDLLAALPLSNFAREIFGGLPIQTVGTDSEQITPPDARQVSGAVVSYLDVLKQFSEFDLEADLLSHLSGDYAVAFIPRPNNPVPVLDAPFDTLFVARVADEEAARAGAVTFLGKVLNLESLEDVESDGWTLSRLGVRNEAVVSLGAQDGLLLVGTGNAVENALDAARGDNRLIAEDTWQTFAEAQPPILYLDTAIFLNTFFPTPGGSVPSGSNRIYFALNTDDLGAGIYQLQLTGIVPNQQ